MSRDEAPLLLKPGDLFEDREVATSQGDELAHSKIAEQLAALVDMVPARSNVALYGPWGSGKSGVGNLLREAVTKRKGTKFARFDAYKYAEAPLRRNFISAVATQLDIKDPKYHRDLYTGRTRTEIGIPASKWLKIVFIFVTLLFGVSALIAGIIALIAVAQPEPFGEAFARLAEQTANAALVPAALLSALITLSSKTLQVDRSLGKPESDEQFESLFSDLVADSKAQRLVIFVDEIDRCSADEVVATLDAIRTFLGANKCVFIVAADQHVLEESLTRAAKQETPTNEVNPYYSTGSAYLDKVFQYQVSLPPLLSQRVTRFAADLVSNRDGLWSEINSEYVVSVLVPTHVASPRRVKHLLNAFALSYRLAEERHRQGLLTTDPRIAAPSLAKLVCLRVEFPLFARDLQIDARLPQIVLHLLEAPDEAAADRSWSAQAIERASAYALSSAAPATMMTDDTATDTDDRVKRTILSSNQQLLDYLRRTEAVAGPSRDLVYMHSTGAAFGLDGHLALTIEEAAETADTASIVEQLSGGDADVRRGAIDLLNHLMRTSVGLGAANVARTLLGLYADDSTLPISHVADAASESIAFLVDAHREILDSTTAEAAWNLAAHGRSGGAEKLREAVLTYVESVPTADASFIMRNPEPALVAHRESLASLAAATIVRHNGERTVTDLGHLSDDTLLDLLRAASAAISSAVAAAVTNYGAASEASAVTPTSTQPSASASGTSAAPSVGSDSEPFDPAPIFQALAALTRERIANPSIKQELVSLLLAVGVREGRDEVERLLPEIGPVSNGPLVEAVLDATQRRDVSLWGSWLGAVDVAAVGPKHAAALQELVETLWNAICGEKPPADKSVKSAVIAIRNVAEVLPLQSRPNLKDAVVATLEPAVTDDASATSRSSILDKLQPLRDAELINFAEVCRIVTPSLLETFMSEFGTVVDRTGPLASFLFNDAMEILRLGAPQLEHPEDEVQKLITGVRESQWYEEPFKTELQLIVIVASGVRPSKLAESPNGPDVVALIESYGVTASTVAELWLQIGDMPFEEVCGFVATLRSHGVITDDIANGLKKIRRTWSQEQRASLLRSQIADPDDGRLTPVAASVLGLPEINDDEIANVLIDRFTQCHNNPQRRSLVDVWKTAHITDDTQRKRVINAVVIGLLTPTDGSTPGQGQVEIALDALSQLGSPLPYGIKTALGTAVHNAVTGKDGLEKKAVKILEQLGYATERRGLFGLKKGVKYGG